jgi:hypothetical protein
MFTLHSKAVTVGTRPAGRPLGSLRTIQRMVALLGLTTALLISALNGSLFLDQRSAHGTRIAVAASALAFLLPFVFALLATWLPDRHAMRAVTFASAVAVLVWGAIAILGSGIYLVMIALGLFGCVLASRPSAEDLTPARAYLITIMVMTGLVLAVFALFFHQSMACWSSADPGWQVIPSMNERMAAPVGGPMTCTSHLKDNLSGWLSIGSIALAVTGFALATSMRTPPVDVVQAN